MTKAEIGFHPKQDVRTHRFFWCLNTAWGTVELTADRVALSVLYGSIEIQRFNSDRLLTRDVAQVTLDGRALRHPKLNESVTLADPAHLEAGNVLLVESAATD